MTDNLKSAVASGHAALEVIESELQVMEKQYVKSVHAAHEKLEKEKQELTQLIDSNASDVEWLKDKMRQVQTESDEIDGAQAVEDLNILKSQLEAVKRDEQITQALSGAVPLQRADNSLAGVLVDDGLTNSVVDVKQDVSKIWNSN